MKICLETSAIIAIILGQAEAATLSVELATSDATHCPASCVLEAIIILVRKQSMTTAQAKELVFKLLEDFEISISTLDANGLEHAIDGYAAFGHGTAMPPAVLNFGDCLSYGVAKAASGTLLYTGGDFAATDLA